MTKLQDDLTFEGKSGNRYTFTAYSKDTVFNDVAAVYIFTKRTRNSEGRYKYTLLYVGETESLKDRIPSHEKWSCVNRYGVNSICIHRDDSKSSRLTKESDLIDNYNPPCNDQ